MIIPTFASLIDLLSVKERRDYRQAEDEGKDLAPSARQSADLLEVGEGAVLVRK